MYVNLDPTVHRNETFTIGLNQREFVILFAFLNGNIKDCSEELQPVLLALRNEIADLIGELL